MTVHRLHDAGDAFMTFLYAAAVHLVLHRGHEQHLAGSYGTSFLLLVLVCYLFSDWVSRVRLPWLIPEEVSTAAQFAKTALELVSLYALLMALLSLLESYPEGSLSEQVKSPVFLGHLAFFLGATFLWNLVMFKVMDKISLCDLARATILGGAAELKGTQEYAKRFVAFKREVLAAPARASGLPLVATATAFLVLPAVELVPQLVALHLSLGNPVLGLVAGAHTVIGRPLLPVTLGGSPFERFPAPVLVIVMLFALLAAIYVGLVAGAIWRARGRRFLPPFVLVVAGQLLGAYLLPSVIVIWTLVVICLWVSSVFLFFAANDNDLKSSKEQRRVLSAIGASILLIAYLVAVAMLSSAQLFGLIMTQQILANGFLQYAATPLDDAEPVPPPPAGSHLAPSSP